MIRSELRWKLWPRGRRGAKSKQIKVLPPNTLVCLTFTDDCRISGVKLTGDDNFPIDEEEEQGLLRWFAKALHRHSKKMLAIKDAAKIIRDGSSLLKLLRHYRNVDISDGYARPFFKWQKRRNNSRAFEYLRQNGVVTSVNQKRQLESGEPKAVIAFLRVLKRAFEVDEPVRDTSRAQLVRKEKKSAWVPMKNTLLEEVITTKVNSTTERKYSRENIPKERTLETQDYYSSSISELSKYFTEEMSVARYKKPICSSRGSSMPKFDADGRRQLCGLSQAIRKHAYQSTSPSSEFNYGRRMCQSHDSLASSNRGRMPVKTTPTIEERLRNLLNSDTEGTTESQSSTSTSKHTFDRPPTFELANRGCQGSYSPRLAESKMRVERLNRTTGDETSDPYTDVQKLKQRTRSLSSERSWTQDGPKKRDETANSQFMSAARSPVTTSTPVRCQTPTSAYNQAVRNQRPPTSPKRAAPAHKTPDGIPTRRGLEYTPSSLPMAAVVKNREGAPQQNRPLFRYRKNPQVSPPSSLASHATSDEYVPGNRSPLLQRTPAVNFSPTVARKAKPIRYMEPPSPAYTRTPAEVNSANASDSGLRVSSAASMSSQYSAPNPARRTARRSNFTASPEESKEIHSRKTVEARVQTLDDEHESCKSEDRDSGAILDAEPSVFDFDSSVISESEDEASQATQKQVITASNPNQIQKETVWSRSSTPTLPPLSPYETDVETPRSREPRDSSNVTTTQKQLKSPVRNEVAQLPSYQSLIRKKRAETTKEKPNEDREKCVAATSESHDHHELSPTESARADSCERHKAAIKTKNPGVKVVIKTVQQKTHRNRVPRTSSRASSCEERRVVESHARHRLGKRANWHTKGMKRNQRNSEEYTHYDIEDSSTSKQKLGKYPLFYRSGEDGVAVSRDVEETSSVRSFTTASVTSSVLRRHGKRHHRRHHGNGVSDRTYAKEVRVVNKRFSRLEAHVVTLARSVAQLSSEMRQQNDTANDVEELRTLIEELRRERVRGEPSSRKSSSSTQSKCDNPKATLKAKSRPQRVVKLTKFFGEKPPILSLFLAEMGYEKYIDNFNAEKITMVELPYMDEERLKSIGIPLGPRIRILNEAKKTCFVV